jgi:methionyl-tRNA synthetase
LYESEYKGLYCVGCEKFLTDNDLVDGKCPDHDREPEQVTEKNWFFKLADYLPIIEKKIKSDELKIYPATRKNEVLGLIKQGIPDFSISRSNKSVPWGIDLPWDSEQKAYVWVDALSNYITALDYPDGELFKKFWPAEKQLLALDILKFHTLYWPAILLALDVELPKELDIHGFFTINGKKMSKTIGNVISPNELVDKYGPEVTKYLILSQFSFGSESDIRVDHFTEKYNADLVNGLGNLLNRVTNMIEKYLDGKVDKLDKSDFIEQVNSKIESLKFREALLDIWKLIQDSNHLVDEAKPWDLAKNNEHDKIKEVLQILSNNLYNIAVALESFMPDTAEQIKQIITAKKITKPDKPLFPRLNN